MMETNRLRFSRYEVTLEIALGLCGVIGEEIDFGDEESLSFLSKIV